jgi:hypothetical protein
LKNRYRVDGDTTIIHLVQKDGNILEALIDTEDLELVSSIRGTWYANWDKGIQSYYVKAGMSRDGKVVKVPLHRFIMSEPIGMVIDHQDHNTLDNRKSNLRAITHAQNMQNRKGKRGAVWHERDKTWEARVRLDNKLHYLGRFDTEEEALRVSKEFRESHMEYSMN